MSNIFKTSAVFKSLEGAYIIRLIAATKNTKGEIVFPPYFTVDGSAKWELSCLTNKTRKPLYEEVAKEGSFREEENDIEEENSREAEYTAQLESLCTRQSRSLQDQHDLIISMKNEISRLNKEMENYRHLLTD